MRSPGFQGSGALRETFHVDTGRFGLKHAPRVFGLARDQEFRVCGLAPLHANPQLWAMRDGSQFVSLASTHLDDLKAAAEEA
eukprot:3412345-Lingulodinium_polyedra.AAC.1